jgi:hypothetical protein
MTISAVLKWLESKPRRSVLKAGIVARAGSEGRAGLVVL